MKVLFAVVLTVCVAQGGKKVCHEEQGPGGFTFKQQCLNEISSAVRARNRVHDGELVSGRCHPTYIAQPKPKPRVERRPPPDRQGRAVRPRDPAPVPAPRPTALTATAELCGTYHGTTDTCLRQTWRTPYSSRSECIKKGKELLEQGQRAFGYVRIPPPYKPTVRCLGETIDVPEASEPIIPEPTPKPSVEAKEEPQPPSLRWRWIAFGLAPGAILLGLVLWLAWRSPAPPQRKRKK